MTQHKAEPFGLMGGVRCAGCDETWPCTVHRLQVAFDDFSKAVSLPSGPSLAVQRHDPSWAAWKKLCDAFASSGVGAEAAE